MTVLSEPTGSNPFHDPLAKPEPAQEASQSAPAPVDPDELFVAPNLDELVYVVFGKDGTRVEKLDDPAEGMIDPPFEPVDYLKIVTENLPPSKSRGRSRRRNRNRTR